MSSKRGKQEKKKKKKKKKEEEEEEEVKMSPIVVCNKIFSISNKINNIQFIIKI
jgi:hypothetical protein